MVEIAAVLSGSGCDKFYLFFLFYKRRDEIQLVVEFEEMQQNV